MPASATKGLTPTLTRDQIANFTGETKGRPDGSQHVRPVQGEAGSTLRFKHIYTFFSFQRTEKTLGSWFDSLKWRGPSPEGWCTVRRAEVVVISRRAAGGSQTVGACRRSPGLGWKDKTYYRE